MNIIQIGLGPRGRQWLEVVRNHPGVTCVGCVDSDGAALEWARAQVPHASGSCYSDLSDALANTKAEAAIVSSPTALHATHAIMALEAGMAVMLDAPFAERLADAARVIEISRRSGRCVLVAEADRFARMDRTVQQLVREGRVGAITHVSCIDRRSRPPAGRELARTDYVQLRTAGAHHFDSLRSILHVNPISVRARCTNAPWSEYRHGATTEAILEMEGNILVQYHGTLTSNRDEYSLWIEGDKGAVRTNQSQIWWRKRGWRFFLPLRLNLRASDAGAYQREGMATLLDQLEAAAVERRAPDTSGDDNVWTLSMTEAAILSDKTGRVVDPGDLLSEVGLVPPRADARQQGR